MRKVHLIAVVALFMTVLATPLTASACGESENPYPPVTRFDLGMRGTVAFTMSGDPLRVREQPGLSAKYLTQLQNGVKFTVTSGPEHSNNYLWWKITTEDGKISGWVAEGAYDEYYIAPLKS
jgi:hypothetical protein